MPTLYRRAQNGLIQIVKDGSRSFVTAEELERYLAARSPSRKPEEKKPTTLQRAVLGHLPDDERIARMALVLRLRLEGMTLEKVAAQIGRSKDLVRQIEAKALRQLKAIPRDGQQCSYCGADPQHARIGKPT